MIRAVDPLFDEAWLTVDELCRCVPVTAQWVHERIAAGLIEAAGEAPASWRFDAFALRRVRRIAVLERDFDAVPELAALVADLEAEIARLRARLAHVGLE